MQGAQVNYLRSLESSTLRCSSASVMPMHLFPTQRQTLAIMPPALPLLRAPLPQLAVAAGSRSAGSHKRKRC